MILQGGAGDMATNPLQVLETISHWMINDQTLLKTRAENSQRLGKPFAARDIAQIVWQGAQIGPEDRRKHRIAGRTSLQRFIKTYQTPFFDKISDIRSRIDRG